MRLTAIAFCFYLVFLAACGKKKACCGFTEIPAGKKVLVLCEGNFQWGNADFDVYKPDSDSVYRSVFKSVNQSPLGDVLHSGLVTTDGVWLVLNNSGKLVQVSRNDFTFQKEIKGLKSPRYMFELNSDTALVTDLYASAISKVSYKGLQKSGSIGVGGWTEQMVRAGNRIAVASYPGKVYLLDNSGNLVDSVTTRSGCQWLVADKNNKVWAFATDSGKTEVYRIDPGKAVAELTMKSPKYLHNPVMNRTGDSLYFLGKGIFRMGVGDADLPTAPIAQVSGVEYYSLGIDPWKGNLYLGNARDYVSDGEVLVFSGAGALLIRFNCGIIPGNFLFLD